jgi:hypothetical protein
MIISILNISCTIMSRDKRKYGPLDSFVTISKKTFITPLSSEGSGPDHSQLSTLEVAQPVGGEFEEPDSVDSCDVNQSLNIIDSQNVDIDAMEILDLFVQKHRRRLDFGL